MLVKMQKHLPTGRLAAVVRLEDRSIPSHYFARPGKQTSIHAWLYKACTEQLILTPIPRQRTANEVSIATGSGNGRKSGTARADVFSTRYKISSNRPSDCTWMCRLGRSETMDGEA